MQFNKIKFFVDSANLEAISTIDFLQIDGVTTNPSLASQNIKLNTGETPNSKTKFEHYKTLLKNISEKIPGDVSGEVVSEDFETMKKEALELASIAKNIVVKLPTTRDGLKLCRTLSEEHNIAVNMTLCFSPSQALLCAKNGAKYVSPFIGRLDDLGLDGLELIKDIKTIYNNYNFPTKILAASVRNIGHVIELLKIGADVITMPPSLFETLYKHILTDKAMEIFSNDWNK